MNLIEQYIEANSYAKLLGMNFEVREPGVVIYTLRTTVNHLATPGFVHGGVFTSLLDAAMGVGALTLVEKDFKVVSTVALQVNFLKAAPVDVDIFASSSVVRIGKKIIFMTAELRDNHGTLLAVSNASFYPFSAEKAGYKKI